MPRLLINTFFSTVLGFTTTSYFIIQLDQTFSKQSPDNWFGGIAVMILAFIIGLVAAVVGGIAAYRIGSYSVRPIDRWDLLGWLVGFLCGLALVPLISRRWIFIIQCIIAITIILWLMLFTAWALQLSRRPKHRQPTTGKS